MDLSLARWRECWPSFAVLAIDRFATSDMIPFWNSVPYRGT
jgi:hypothetical protein